MQIALAPLSFEFAFIVVLAWWKRGEEQLLGSLGVMAAHRFGWALVVVNQHLRAEP